MPVAYQLQPSEHATSTLAYCRYTPMCYICHISIILPATIRNIWAKLSFVPGQRGSQSTNGSTAMRYAPRTKFSEDTAFWRRLLLLGSLFYLVTAESELSQESETDFDVELKASISDMAERRFPNGNGQKPSPERPFWTNLFQNKRDSKPVKKQQFKQDDVGSFGSFDRHPCRRVCQRGQSLSCYYRLVVHNYQRLGPECNRCQSDVNACEGEHCIYGDGVPTPVMAFNRMVPGPPIEVCENDTLVLDVLNYLSEATTVHWHGFHMSQTPEMDGAPFTTQYPLQPGEVYRYAFPADRSGTLWYHSHMGWQRALGVAGALVVRQTREANRQANLYDYDLIEHTLVIQDIVYNYDFTRVRNILINGKGRNHLTTLPDNDPRNRYERLRVSPGYRYRMRVISNGIFSCPIELSIEKHRMLMISADGNDIEPIYADSFFMAAAERFDFVLEANQYASNYWVRVRGYGNCSTENLYQGAVLHYRGAARNTQPQLHMTEASYGRADGQAHTAVNVLLDQTAAATKADLAPATLKQDIATSGLRALDPIPWPRYTQFLTYYSSFGARTLANGDVVFQIDDITFDLPGVSLLQARDLYDEDTLFCNRSALATIGRNCARSNCQCTNVIRLPAYKPIELVVVNYSETTHPFHTHGYTYRLVGQAVIGSVADLRRIQDLDRRGQLQRLPADFPAVQKDTVQIPGLGYIIVRFVSDNPGYWMYHCHIDEHALLGMTAILKVGENYQMRKVPTKVRC